MCFVLHCLVRLKGGEIFIPRIPSYKTQVVGEAIGELGARGAFGSAPPSGAGGGAAAASASTSKDDSTVAPSSSEDASARLPQLTKIVGIRPGEKLHEVMIPCDEAPNTLQFSGHFVICPAAGWFAQRKKQLLQGRYASLVDFMGDQNATSTNTNQNATNATTTNGKQHRAWQRQWCAGAPVPGQFEYNSGANEDWVDKGEIQQMVLDMNEEDRKRAQSSQNAVSAIWWKPGTKNSSLKY